MTVGLASKDLCGDVPSVIAEGVDDGRHEEREREKEGLRGEKGEGVRGMGEEGGGIKGEREKVEGVREREKGVG